MLTLTSKGEFPYDKGRESGWQMDTEDSSDNPQGILTVAVGHKIIIFFIKPSDFNLSGIFVCMPVCACVCVGGSYLKPGDKYHS